MKMENAIGVFENDRAAYLARRERMRRQLRLLLVANGMAASDGQAEEIEQVAGGLLAGFIERTRLLTEHRAPVDQRIDSFLAKYFPDEELCLPEHTLVLSEHGLARELSLPENSDELTSPLLTSYRVRNGVLHNPRSDRRTTEGTFHVAEGGLPIPGDKKAVPKNVFAEMFRQALHPPDDMLTLPFTANQKKPARGWASLLLRPTVCPEVPGVTPYKSMEVRFFAPGTLVSNLDFVESIFGNGGDPFLPRNDAGLDVEHWTGHTGCVILAPHLVDLTKKQLGLPNISQATARQKRDRMYWEKEDEKYNDGVAFKLTFRAADGVIVTLIADNYYGYCKKEVKTQISFAANLYGNVEEEHAGGAIAFPSYSYGEFFYSDSRTISERTFADVVRDYGALMHLKPEGYGIDKKFPDVLYIPETAKASVARQEVWWEKDGKEQSIQLLPSKVYITPSGFKVHMEKHPGAPSWRIIGTMGEGTFCHKPCTVSGGGKSEISKSLRDYMIYGPIFVTDIEKDLDYVEQIFNRDYSTRWQPGAGAKPDYNKRPSRAVLSPQRSVGSVIKLLTPSPEYNEEYNTWLASIPNHIYPIVFIIKRFYNPEWKGAWREHFSVDIVNGYPGHELKFDERKLVGSYLRVGLMKTNAWRTYKLRQDFAAAAKIQTEDDISASVVVPANQLSHLRDNDQSTTMGADQVGAPHVHAGLPRIGAFPGSVKFAVNCEYRLFQRPDDAIHRGLDKQTELDLSRADNFISNFQPLTPEQAREMVEQVTEFDQFTPPMRQLLKDAAQQESGFVVSSSNPRLVDGKPTKNPRYLQNRPDLMNPMAKYVAEVGTRLSRAVPLDKPVHMPVDAILVGRRNNPAEPQARIRGLAVYNPIHYQELPELFMDFICSLTGKSPSTTGAGSEGALTKGPFNALRPIIDLNAALVSYILTGLGGFSSSAGYIGPKVRVDHDVSLLIPEIFCRLSPRERDPQFLIAEGYLEPLKDYKFDGETILASRLGYRITDRFVRAFCGRIFDNPDKVFDETILKPETQDPAAFADGVKNITEAQQRVARTYLEDESINDASPPLRALLMIMANGSFEGKDAHHADIRNLFMRESLLASDWYARRLRNKQQKDIALWKRHLAYIDDFLSTPTHADAAERMNLASRRAYAERELKRCESAEYLKQLIGTLGADSVR